MAAEAEDVDRIVTIMRLARTAMASPTKRDHLPSVFVVPNQDQLRSSAQEAEEQDRKQQPSKGIERDLWRHLQTWNRGTSGPTVRDTRATTTDEDEARLL